MHGSLARRYELLPNPDRDWQIRQPIPMKVTNFPAAHVEEDHATSIDIHSDVRPRANLLLNPSGNGVPSHLP